MVTVDDFVAAPSEGLLDSCTVDQLAGIADYYRVDLGGLPDKRKGTIKARIIHQLVEKGVLGAKAEAAMPSPSPPLAQVGPVGALTFEQQKELLLLQLAHDKETFQLELEQKIVVERLRRDTEQVKLEMVRDGRLSGDFLRGEEYPVGSKSSDLVANLRLVPKFNEQDPDVFFSMFERVAETRAWSDSEQILLLQSVLTGKAQEAYVSLRRDNLAYREVKAAVLKAFELVPEAYRQRFRSWEKRPSQSHMEFVRELSNHFEHWCVSLGVDDFESLCNLIVLEQFKNSLPADVTTYLAERKVTTVEEAAGLADEYVLIHKKWPNQLIKEPLWKERSSKTFGFGGSSGKESRGPPQKDDDACRYCREMGHWKADCPLLRSKPQYSGGGKVKPTALAASVFAPPVRGGGGQWAGAY